MGFGQSGAWTTFNERADMATSSHAISTKQVRIAELKARLSEYLSAKRGGESIAVLDHDTPIAQLIPVRELSALRVRKPAHRRLIACQCKERTKLEVIGEARVDGGF